MRQEYDFSKGERGRFYHESAKLNLPVYLEEDVRRYLDERAESNGRRGHSNLSTRCCVRT